jgi:hypothetical protein
MSGLRTISENPFYVLGLGPDASRAAIERQGQTLLDQLELGIASVKIFRTPLGESPRDAERVRWALAVLRDPAKRLAHELWATLPGAPLDAPPDPMPPPWDRGFAATGLGRRR